MPFMHSANEPASLGAVRVRCGVIVTAEEVFRHLLYEEPPPCPDCATLEALDFEPTEID